MKLKHDLKPDHPSLMTLGITPPQWKSHPKPATGHYNTVQIHGRIMPTTMKLTQKLGFTVQGQY